MTTSRYKTTLRWKLVEVCFAVTTASISQQLPFELIQPTCEFTYGRDVSILSDVKSLLACGALCTHDGQCLSVMYHPESTACHTNHDVTQLLSLPVDCGWMYVGLKLYGKPCSGSFSSERYRCVSDVYDCAIGFAFNPSTEECVLGCLQYGNTFQVVPYHYIGGADDYSQSATSYEECRDICLAYTDFVCVAFEFVAPVNKCVVQNESGVYRSIVEDTSRAVYVAHRNCA